MKHPENIKDFFDGLNYSESPYFFDSSRLSEVTSYSHVFRIAQKKCGLKGVYALERSTNNKLTKTPTIPLVYFCEASSEKEAIEIHRLVWNQNSVPFLLVLTPKTVRLYPGFRFDTSEDACNSDQHLFEIARSANDILEQLSDFTAESINTGRIWQKWYQKVTPETRVDQNLLHNLGILGKWLRDNGLSRQIAHSLIGKYVYLRYLRDRDILSDRKLSQWGIDFNSIFGSPVTASGFFALVKKLDQWLNGSIFPIQENEVSSLLDEHITKVASTFLGDDPASGQMHLDFRAYNFEHIPIETLSMVYQQFLHSEKRGPKQGAYYTPVHLVNFMLDELDGEKMLRKGMKVLDPACGSGAFIVQCFRRLIEREMETRETLCLKPSELKMLLVNHIFGLEIDEDACGVTELSLALTLLDYIDPPDLEEMEYRHFKLPALRNRNIFFCPTGFFDDESIEMKVLSTKKFDWIVGNPPWNQVPEKPSEPADIYALDWMVKNKKECPVNQKQLAEAFIWKSSLYLSKDGVTGFLLPGLTLFKIQKNAIEFRKRFFSKMDVWCVVNFANLRHVLFHGADNPAAAFFYRSSQNNSHKPESILTYAPFAINQMPGCNQSSHAHKKLWTVLVNADEMREIPYRDIVNGECFPWKMAMWGTIRDKFLLVSIGKAFVSLSEYERAQGLDISQGLELRDVTTKEEIEALPEVSGKNLLDMNALTGCGKIFFFPKKVLKTIPKSKAYVRKGRGKKTLDICQPPHVIVDANRRFSVYSDRFVVVPPRQIGISGDRSKSEILKALALYLSSDFVQYQQCLSSSSWGIERGRLSKQDLLALPIPLDHLSSDGILEWAELYDKLSKHFSASMEHEPLFMRNNDRSVLKRLLDDMNEKVNTVLGLNDDEKCLIHDFITTRIKLNDGAIPEEALASASPAEIMAYSKTLKKTLDEFLDSEIKDQHRITARFSSSMVLLTIEHPEKAPAGQVSVSEIADSALKAELKTLEQNLRFEQGQWVYFQKNLKLFHGRSTTFVKSRQRLCWLQSQAFTDAEEFIAEKLTPSGYSK